jgi:hypothetical protein
MYHFQDFTFLFELRRYEVTNFWRKLRNEELHNLQFSRGVIKAITKNIIRRTGPKREISKMF